MGAGGPRNNEELRMNKVRASMTLMALLGAGLANFMGCTADEPPPDNPSGGSGSGSSSGVATTCGDGKLDMAEACDDGNNSSADGCSDCVVDECYSCTNEADKLSTCTVAAAGTACQSTKVCDSAGKCVECVEDTQCNGGFCHQNVCFKCDDGMKNGDETDVDCGGAKCTTKCADGKLCGAATDCTSTFCADGVCCAEACDGACLVCNLAGSEGVCEFTPKYDEDLNAGAGGCSAADGKVCNGAGLCSGALGAMCTGPTGCASGKCGDPDGDMMKTCVKNMGEDCTMNAECFSNTCDMTTMKCM